jgi:hypothetical protein
MVFLKSVRFKTPGDPQTAFLDKKLTRFCAPVALPWLHICLTPAVIDMGYADSWISFWKFTSALSDNTKLEIWNYTVGSDQV